MRIKIRLERNFWLHVADFNVIFKIIKKWCMYVIGNLIYQHTEMANVT